MPKHSLTRSVIVAVLATSCAASPDEGTVQSAVAASTQTNAWGVPEGKVLAPRGRLLDAACVFEVPEGASVDREGNVTRGGVVVDHHRPCSAEQGAIQVPQVNGNIEWTETNATMINGVAVFDQLFATWTVPPKPPAHGQLVYFYPGLENVGTNEILQPVLSYGNNNAYGGDYWSFASWYVGPAAGSNGNHSPPLIVHPGDSLTGTVTEIGPKLWKVRSQNNTTGEWTELLSQPSAYPMYRAYGGVLEAYSITTCSDYPSTSPIQFTNIGLRQGGPAWNSFNITVNPQWTNNVVPGVNPSCGFNAVPGVQSLGLVSTATLYY